MAEEPNGDTVTVRGTGRFDKDADSATGGGTFVYKSANGTVLGSGTWTATGLVTFQFFGCGSLHGSPRPATVCGGRVLLNVHLVGNEAGSPLAADGMLTVICEAGNPPDGRIPEGMMEGSKLNIPGLSNFNEQVSGNTVFIRAT